MKIAVRYFTRSGNTQKLAEAIGSAIGEKPETIDTPLAEKVDLLLLGTSYYAFDMDPAVKAFLAANKEKIGKVACFGTSAMMKSMKRPMKNALKGTSIVLADEEFHCRGQFHRAHKGRPDANDLALAAEFARKLAGR